MGDSSIEYILKLEKVNWIYGGVKLADLIKRTWEMVF